MLLLEGAMVPLPTRARHAFANFYAQAPQTVSVTLKFSGRNGRSRHFKQKNTMVLVHFTSQTLPWSLGHLPGARTSPETSQRLPRDPPETLRSLRYAPKVPKVRPLGPPLNSFKTSLRWLEMKNVIFMEKWNVTYKNAVESHFMINL